MQPLTPPDGIPDLEVPQADDGVHISLRRRVSVDESNFAMLELLIYPIPYDSVEQLGMFLKDCAERWMAGKGITEDAPADELINNFKEHGKH